MQEDGDGGAAENSSVTDGADGRLSVDANEQ